MKNDDQDVYGLKFFLLMFLAFNLSSAFTFQCPSPYQWDLRAESHCITTEGYICLFDENENIYKEICRNKTYFDPAGYKLVIAGNLDRRKCESAKYQPFKFFTNGSSVCIFEKSYCSDEGQIIFNNGSTESDRQCRCDYTRGYDFITKPKHGCYCVPSIEDCSCYQKPCPPGSIVSPDYQCINLTSWNSQFTCELILPFMPKDTTTFPSNHNTLDDSKIALERNVRIVISIMIGVTIIFTLIIVQITWFCLPKIDSFKDARENVKAENFELRSILAGQVIPKNIRDVQEHIKTQWRERFSNFVETRASKAIIERIKEEQCIIISGPFGCGKSSLAFHIALKLEETLEYDFMIISNPDDLLKYASEDKKQVFLMDDVFGKHSVSEYDSMWWNRQGESFQHLLTRNANLILLMTSRLHIYKYLSVNEIQLKINVCHINLISEDLVLTFEERKNIEKCYLPDDIIDNLGEKVVLLYSFFPLLCANFYEHRTDNDIQYFSLPLEHIKTEIENIRKPQDLFYLALSVLIVCDNNVQKEFLNQNNHEYDEMLKFVSKELGFGKKPAKQLLILRLIALTGSYVTETESSFECLNVNLFNVLAFFIGPSIMHSILRYGTMSFIIERMQPEASNGHYPKLTIMIPNSLQDNYFERMLLDMKTALHNIFIGSQHLSAEFRKSFIAYMKKHLKKGDLRKDADGTTVLHFVSSEGYADYVEFFLKLDKKIAKGLDYTGQTALHKTCIKGHTDVARLLLDNGTYIDQFDNNSETALDIACDFGLSEMVDFLLSRHANIFQKKTDLKSALHVACNNNNLMIAELLLKKNSKAVIQQDYDGYTPLHIACEKGFFEIAKMLIIHKAIVDIDDKHGMTPLYIACKNGNIKEAELLLRNKANPNKCDEFQKTPIFIACEKKHLYIIRLLLKYKADVNCKNITLLTPLHDACRNNNIDIILLLIKHDASVNEPDIHFQTPLFIACSKGYRIVKGEIVKNSDSVTKADQNGETSLHVDDKEENEEIVKVLLNAGANVNKGETNGITPIHMACKAGKEKIVKLLINAGVDVSKGDKNGITPLGISHEDERNEIISLLSNVKVGVSTGDTDWVPALNNACNEGNEETVKVLLNAGANVNEGDKDGMTPLHVACKGGREQFVTLLINAGANVNEIDNDGMTPLHVACKGGQEEIVILLINAGVNVNKGDKNGITPLQMACKEGSEGIVKVLLNSVANVNVGDNEGTTPLHVACKSGYKDIVTLLLDADANVNKCDKNGIKPLHIAYKGGSEETLYEDEDGFTLLKETIVTMLLNAGANTNNDEKDGMTFIQRAYTEGKKTMREILSTNS